MVQLDLRPYQIECINKAKNENLIVNLPTGTGKTLVAVKVIDHFLATFPTKKVAFLVPTCALVEQQADYIEKHCTIVTPCNKTIRPTIEKAVGNEHSGWTNEVWETCIRETHVFVGTSASIHEAIVTEKRIELNQISLIVFDECHNATGNSPMASLLRDAVAPHYAAFQNDGSETSALRILGLTASFVNGSLKNIDRKRKQMEALMQSTIYCPCIESKLTDDSFQQVKWTATPNMKDHKDMIENHVDSAIQKVGAVKEYQKVIRRCIHVFEQLGQTALMHFVNYTILQQIESKAKQLIENTDDDRCVKLGSFLLSNIPSMKNHINTLSSDLQSVASAPVQTKKLQALIATLESVFKSKGSQHRGIVFVEQVALVSPMAHVLNIALASVGVKCGAVAGSGHQSSNDRESQLSKFKNGEIRVLAATATLEEGIDVADCGFVVRFTNVATTKAHIQGSGRARQVGATIFYFDNDPAEERAKEANMNSSARASHLSLKKEERKLALTEMTVLIERTHPYPFNSTELTCDGQVNVFNCKQLFNQYCSIMLASSVQPKTDLYKYSNHPGSQKVLKAIRYPTPTGWKYLAREEFRQFWNGVNATSVFAPIRSKKKSASDKEEMMFVYVIVIMLREYNLLDRNNVPIATGVSRYNTKDLCKLNDNWTDAIRLNNIIVQPKCETQ